jgi:hypothetical protein
MHFRTRGQIQRVLERRGLIDICCNYAGNGVEARGRRGTEKNYGSRGDDASHFGSGAVDPRYVLIDVRHLDNPLII